MCLAIFKPANQVIPVDHLREGWISNPDGGGFAFVRKGKVVVRKGFMQLKEFLAAYETVSKKNPDSPMLVHFRIRSMGGKGEENTHPFEFNNTALIHNGTLSGTGAQPNNGKSDTCLFVEKYKDLLTYDNLNKHKKEFDDAIGYNKMALLFGDGRHLILNEQGGYWRNDIWYSNLSYVPSRHLGTPLHDFLD